MLAMDRTRTQRNSRGFTLVEVLVSLAVLGILLAAGVPAMTGMSEQNRMKDLIFKLSDDMQTARSQAITSNVNRILAVTSGATWSYSCATCAPAVAASSADYSGITLTATNAPLTFSTTGNAAGATAGTASIFTLQSSSWTVTATVTPIGKVHVCANATGLGYPAC